MTCILDHILIPLPKSPINVQPLNLILKMVPVDCGSEVEQTLGVTDAPVAGRHQPHGSHNGLHINVIKHILVGDPQHQLLEDVAHRHGVLGTELGGLRVALVVSTAKLLGHPAAPPAKVAMDDTGLALVLLAVLLLLHLQSNHVLDRGNIEDNCHGGEGIRARPSKQDSKEVGGKAGCIVVRMLVW